MTENHACNEQNLCADSTHTSLNCYFRYVELEYEGAEGGPIMSHADWKEAS